MIESKLPPIASHFATRKATHWRGRAFALSLRSLIVFGLALAFLAAGKSETSGNKIGICGPISMMSATKAAGFDYSELSIAEIVALSDADFAQLQSQIKH